MVMVVVDYSRCDPTPFFISRTGAVVVTKRSLASPNVALMRSAQQGATVLPFEISGPQNFAH